MLMIIWRVLYSASSATYVPLLSVPPVPLMPLIVGTPASLSASMMSCVAYHVVQSRAPLMPSSVLLLMPLSDMVLETMKSPFEPSKTITSYFFMAFAIWSFMFLPVEVSVVTLLLLTPVTGYS